MLTIQILSEWMDYLTQKQADISVFINFIFINFNIYFVINFYF